MKTKAFSMVVVVVAATAACLAPGAAADQPVTTVTRIDRTTTFAAGRFCPFSFTFTPLTIVKSTGRQDPSQFPATCEGLA